MLAIKANKTVIQVPGQFTTATPSNTFDDPRSNRQVIVELLAFSQVNFPTDPNEGIIMMKASESLTFITPI